MAVANGLTSVVKASLARAILANLLVSLGVAATVGSRIQPIVLVASLLVFWGPLLGEPINLAFTGFEVVAIMGAPLITLEIIGEGKSNWFEGCLLLGVYAILAVGGWSRRSSAEGGARAGSEWSGL